MRSNATVRIALAAALGLGVLGAAGFAVPQAEAAATRVGTTSASQRIMLGLNKSVVVDLPSDAYDILVANPAVADAVTRTSRRIYLFGKAVGETNIFVFGANGEQIASLNISVERDVAGLEANLRRFIPGSDIKVELVNDNVVLTGTVDTPLDAKRAADLATAFVTGGEATTGQYSQTAAGGSSQSGVDINNPDSQRQKSAVINLLQIVGDDQVTLKVTVAEISRNVMKQLGIKMIGQANGIRFDAFTPDSLLKLGTSNAPNLGHLPSYLEGTLNAMEQSGVMKTLAEPTLSAVSGEQATFKVGGQFNFLVTQDRNTTVQAIDYGIGLEFQPVVLSAGRISLKVRTSVSEPTSGGDGQDVTGAVLSLRKRLADTTVELPSGGSMMIAGLINDNVRQSLNAVPGLTKVPVLGALFRSREFVRNESELVIIVTPYLVRPVARNDLARPDDNFNAPSDGAGIFLGRVNRVYGTMQTDKPDGRYHGVVGFIYK